MAIHAWVPSLSLTIFHRYIDPRSSGARFLFVLCLLLVTLTTSRAQTPAQQYVYGSLGGPPPSSVAGFSKASQTGALSLVPGSPFSERLEGGLVAIDGQGKFLFVLNPTSNDISMFQINQASGALSEVPGSPFAVPPTVNPSLAPSQPISITAEPSGKFLFVGYFWGDYLGYSTVAELAIDTSGLSPILRTVGSFGSVGAPVQLLTDSKGLHLYVGLGIGPSGNPVGVGGAQVYSIDDSTGVLSYRGMAAFFPSFGLNYAIDPQDRFFFLQGGDVGDVMSCIISPVDGTANTCFPIYYFGILNSSAGIVVESSGHFLYIPQGQSVAVFSIDQTTGALTQVASVSGVFSGKGSFVADPMGPYIYSAGLTISPTVHTYQVDQQTGGLTEIPGSPFNPGTVCCQGLAISGNPVQAISGPAATIFPSTAATFAATAGTSSATQVFSIVNIGNQLLAINSISIAGTNPTSFSQTNTCLATLTPNANCSVSITFNPASVGTFTAGLRIADNAPSSPQTLLLSGTGVAPVAAVTFSPATPSFPATTQGTSSVAQTLTLINSGTGPLHVSSVSLGGPNPSDISFTNNCMAPVSPAANCTISLVFSPIAPGQRTASLVISDDAPDSPQMVTLSAIATPAITAAGTTAQNVAAGQTANYTLTLNPGNGFSGMISLACSGAPLGATCSVPPSVAVGTPFTVSVTTSGASHALLPYSNFPRVTRTPLLFALCTFVLCLLALLTVGNRVPQLRSRRLAWTGALATMLFLAVITSEGCGGMGATPIQQIVTPPGNYILTVTPSATNAANKPLQLPAIQLTLNVSP
jgi:hypothetical protein